MPLFSRFYGIHPHQIDELTYGEVSEYRARLKQIQSEGGDLWQVGGGS